MTGYSFGVNEFWLYLVILHVMGSIVFGVMTVLPLGSLCCVTAAWLIYVFIFREKSGKSKNKTIYFIAASGWLATAVLVMMLPVSYSGSMLMNGLMVLAFCYICRVEHISVRKTFMIRWISVTQWPILMLLSVLLFIIAVYVNNVSMLFFNNMIADSLAGSGKYFWQSVLVFALLPAVVEELLFRGYIFRSSGGGRTAIVLSAVLFALLHMNFNQMVYGFVMGIFFAVIVKCTDNLSMTMAVHFLFNLFNIVIAAFPDQPVLSAILHTNLNGYYLFLPSLNVENSVMNAGILCTGAVVALVCAGAATGLFCWIGQKRRGKKTDGGKQNCMEFMDVHTFTWTPDQKFIFGSLICIVVAVSYELL